MKKLMTNEIRFIVKKIDSMFRVYDKARGSFPYRTKELGVIVQDVSEKEAQAEADRLNGTKLEQPAPPVEETTSVEEVDIPDLPDYGEPLTEEEAKKYEDGTIEKGVY